MRIALPRGCGEGAAGRPPALRAPRTRDLQHGESRCAACAAHARPCVARFRALTSCASPRRAPSADFEAPSAGLRGPVQSQRRASCRPRCSCSSPAPRRGRRGSRRRSQSPSRVRLGCFRGVLALLFRTSRAPGFPALRYPNRGALVRISAPSPLCRRLFSDRSSAAVAARDIPETQASTST